MNKITRKFNENNKNEVSKHVIWISHPLKSLFFHSKPKFKIVYFNNKENMKEYIYKMIKKGYKIG